MNYVISARVSGRTKQAVEGLALADGKTAGVWVRELIERELGRRGVEGRGEGRPAIAPRRTVVEAVSFEDVRERDDIQAMLREQRILGDSHAYALECGHWSFGCPERMLVPVGDEKPCSGCKREAEEVDHGEE